MFLFGSVTHKLFLSVSVLQGVHPHPEYFENIVPFLAQQVCAPTSSSDLSI